MKQEAKKEETAGGNLLLPGVSHPTRPIKATELRLGNCVRAKSPELTKFEEPVIVDIHYFEMFCRKRPAVHFEAIPLTDAWFKIFGFTETTCEGEKFFELQSEEHPLFFKGDKNGFIECVFEIEPHRRVRYVHELQNLYHAVTGRELSW